MLDTINTALTTIDDFIWGLPLIIAILAVGLFMTFRLKGLQVTKFPLAVKELFSNERSGEDGEVSSFAALCTALSATIGTGNIVGVATAMVAGGPGALFWMWIAAIVGTVTKYSECLLAVKYRVVNEDGHILGGPFYYIENGMGHKWKWLAKIFAFFGVGVGLLGIGTFTQINGITSAVNGFFDANNEWTVDLFGRTYSWTVIITGILLTVCVALVIICGNQRISSVEQVIVPFMAGCYVVAGVARGIFSNEAGLGSAPIAAAAANSDSPAQQGLISMTGTVIDTIIICTMTGLAITITGTWNVGLQGVAVTTAAFQQGLPVPAKVSAFVLMMCLVFFAFTTILGWDYYSEKCLEYLVGGRQKVVKGYRWLYIVCVFIGPFMTVSAVWKIADIFNGLMAIPNLIAIVALSGVVVAETRKYMEQVAQGERAGAKKKAKGMENAQESEVVSNE